MNINKQSQNAVTLNVDLCVLAK